jgi:hypothetical protein
VPGRPIGPWSRRTGAPKASAFGPHCIGIERFPAVTNGTSFVQVAGRSWGEQARVRYDRDSERFFAFAMLACDRLGDNRLPDAIQRHARSP